MSYIEGDLFTGAPDEPVDPIAGAAEPDAPAARAAGETLTREEARAWEADLRSLGAELQLEDEPGPRAGEHSPAAGPVRAKDGTPWACPRCRTYSPSTRHTCPGDPAVGACGFDRRCGDLKA